MVYRLQGNESLQIQIAQSSSKTCYASYYVPVAAKQAVMGQSQSSKVGDVGKKKKKRTKFRGRLTEIRDIERMKHHFMTKGKLPPMSNNGDDDEDYEDDEAVGTEKDKSKRPVSFSLFHEAKRVLKQVVFEFGSGDRYLEVSYGKKISYIEATERLLQYLHDNGLDGAVTVIWSKKLACSALMVAKGHSKRPENRRYVLYIKDSEDNPYLREKGIYCLINHEVFTHYVCQNWFSFLFFFGFYSNFAN